VRTLAARIALLPILDAQAALFLVCGMLALLLLRTAPGLVVPSPPA
jgi:hypothetical protein